MAALRIGQVFGWQALAEGTGTAVDELLLIITPVPVYGGPGEMGMGMRMRMRIRMRMRACIAQTCTLLSESALPFHMLRTYPYDAGVLAFGLAFVFVFVLSRIMRVFGLA